MSNIKYRQCNLRKIVPNGITYTTSWLPEEYAEIGRFLKLRDDNDVWVNGWKVIGVSETFVTKPPDYRKSIREHKKRTGDSLPKKKSDL